jgi:2-dehydro-3-deoxygluconokinase
MTRGTRTWRPEGRPLGGSRPDVVGVGEAMVLLQAPAGEPLATAAGADILVAGAELNVCAAVARLGGTALFASMVGRDPFGERVLAEAAAHGTDTRLIGVDPDHPTGVFFKEIQPDGARRVYYYRRGSAAAATDERAAAAILAARPRAIIVSGITAALGPGPARLVRALCEGAAGVGAALVLDPNLRPALAEPTAVAGALRPLLDRVDLLVLGQDESGELLGPTGPAEVFDAAQQAGAGEVVLKGGADGLWYAGADGRPCHMPSTARQVRDPVGAGDALLGGYLAARLAGAAPAGAAWLGCRLAAGVVETLGDTAGLPERASAARLLARACEQRP